MKTRTCTLALALLLAVGATQAATIYSDGFDRADTTPDDLGAGWAITTQGTRDVSISSQQAFFDWKGTTNGDIKDAWASALQDLPVGFTLAAQPGVVSWGVNMTNSGRNGPLLSPVNAGISAMILLASDADITVGSGYGLGQYADTGGGDNTVRLFRYEDGVDGTITELLVTTTTYNKGEWSASRVEYDPTTNQWALYNAAGTALPSTLGTGELVGTATDSTHADVAMVGSGIGHIADAGSGTQGDRDAYFDNVSMDVVPEPATMTLLALGGLAALKRKRLS